MKDILITNEKELEKIKEQISKEGSEKLHVLADFDRTLTKEFVKGKRIPSLLGILRDGNYLKGDCMKKLHEIYEKYSPLETDPKLSFEERKKLMNEWWTTTFDLLIKSGLNKKDLEEISENKYLQFREGFLEFIDFLHEKNIPLIIMSATGLGDVIFIYLNKKGRLYDNVHILTNVYEWDEKGNAIGIKEPIIHSMNKDETSVKNYPVFNEIKDRKNVMLLGDLPEDTKMIVGFDYNNLIKIGFLNSKIEEKLENYKKNFDVIILNDGPMTYINKLLREIV